MTEQQPTVFLSVATTLAAYALNLANGKKLESFEMANLAELAKMVDCTITPPPPEQGVRDIAAALRNEALAPTNSSIDVMLAAATRIGTVEKELREAGKPIPMRLFCPACFTLHIDEGQYADKPHHTHACQNCGNVWRPALAPTVGVQFLPGFKNK